MAQFCSAEARITSKNLRVDWLPCGEAGNHVQNLYFEGGATAGTFKLMINGFLTANITYTDTGATLLTNINSAIDAVLPSAGLVVATGDNLEVVLTAASDYLNTFLVIEVRDIALTGTGLSTVPITTEVVTQGSSLLTLTRDVASFSYEETVETTDTTPIGQFDASMQTTKRMMSFEMTLYVPGGGGGFGAAVRAGVVGIMYVYPEGKIPDKPFFAFKAILTGGNFDFPDHEKVERQLNGERDGEMIYPFDSIYTG